MPKFSEYYSVKIPKLFTLKICGFSSSISSAKDWLLSVVRESYMSGEYILADNSHGKQIFTAANVSTDFSPWWILPRLVNLSKSYRKLNRTFRFFNYITNPGLRSCMLRTRSRNPAIRSPQVRNPAGVHLRDSLYPYSALADPSAQMRKASNREQELLWWLCCSWLGQRTLLTATQLISLF
jgi:hypothetical protein